MSGNIKQYLSDFLSPNNIICGLGKETPAEVRDLLLQALKRHDPSLDLEYARKEVLAREKVFPTVISPGLAVPHARLENLAYPLMALGCAPHADVKKGEVKLTVLLLTPMTQPDLHLQLLAMLAATLSGADSIAHISSLATQDEVYGALCGKNPARIPDFLTAADLVEKPAQTLLETDTLATAIRAFATSGESELVVQDSAGDLRGTLALSQLLRKSLPEHLLWLENLTPIYRFQPFAEMLKGAAETKIADVMNEEFLAVDGKVPAIQLAKLFLVHQLNQLIITQNGKFAGIVTEKAFCARLFWE